MNIKKYLLLTLGIILFNNYCFADSSNYSIYIENVRKKLPEIKKNEISLQKINNDILRTRSIDDIFITMNALFQNIDDKQLSVDRFIDSSHFGTGINFQLQKKFSKTGTVLNFTSSFWDQKYTRDGIDLFDNVYEPMFSLTFSQPLLNNRFGLIDKFSMENAKIKYNIEKLRSTLSDEQIINYYSKKYFDFLANKEIVTLIDQSIKNTNILYKQIKDK